MRKRLLWIDGFLCLAVLAAAAAMLLDQLAPRPGVTPDNFKRLYSEMTEEEAVSVLGRPGVARFGPGPDFEEVPVEYADVVPGFHWRIWSGDQCRVELSVYVPERRSAAAQKQRSYVMTGQMATAGSLTPLAGPKKSPPDKLREWVGMK